MFSKQSFPSLPFRPGNHPLERKKTGEDPRFALLEFAPGFADPNWCTRAHVIYVIAGELSVELDHGRVERVAEGESCVIDGDEPHRARNDGAVPVLLFIASDLEAIRR